EGVGAERTRGGGEGESWNGWWSGVGWKKKGGGNEWRVRVGRFKRRWVRRGGREEGKRGVGRSLAGRREGRGGRVKGRVRGVGRAEDEEGEGGVRKEVVGGWGDVGVGLGESELEGSGRGERDCKIGGKWGGGRCEGERGGGNDERGKRGGEERGDEGGRWEVEGGEGEGERGNWGIVRGSGNSCTPRWLGEGEGWEGVIWEDGGRRVKNLGWGRRGRGVEGNVGKMKGEGWERCRMEKGVVSWRRGEVAGRLEMRGRRQRLEWQEDRRSGRWKEKRIVRGNNMGAGDGL
ncbi:hypothetical protein Tco_0901622, partial [Tanacetum coccineum]